MNKLQLRKQMLNNRVFLHLLQSDSKKNTRQRLNVCTNSRVSFLHKRYDVAVELRRINLTNLKCRKLM